jgi:hypothetical protein
VDERTLQAAAAALEKDWLKFATDKELALLELSAERPELFEVEEGAAISVVLGYNPDPDGPPGPTVVPFLGPRKDERVSENAAALVFKRTRLRARHGLPQDDCAQPPRYGQGTCTCLTRVLDSLTDVEALHHDGVLRAARKLHKRNIPRRRVRKRVPATKAEPLPATAVAPPLERLTETSTKPALKPQLRTDRGDPHPLSWEAFRRNKGGPSLRGITDRKF